MTITGNRSLDAFIESLVLAFVVTAISYGSAIYAGWISQVSWLEAAGVFTAYSCTWMCVRQTRWNYPMGVLNVALLAWLFWDLKLYGLFATNLYLLPWLIFGWIRWKDDSDPRPVTSVFKDHPAWIAGYIVAAVIAYFGMRYVNELLGNPVGWMDSAIFAATIVAQFWLDNKKVETWAVWAIVNVISLWLYATTGQWAFFVQYLFFLGNTLIGWYRWTVDDHRTMVPAE